MIKTCRNCRPHSFQDETYGKNVRVFTETKDGGSKHCTVCGEASREAVLKKGK